MHAKTVLLFVIVLAALGIHPVRAQNLPKNGKIAFSVVQKSNIGAQVRTVDINGTVDTLIDLSDALNSPIISPSGKQIVYFSAKNDNRFATVTIVNVSDHQEHVSTHMLFIEGIPGNLAWSPDGKYITGTGAFQQAATATYYKEDGAEDFGFAYIVPSDGSDNARLTYSSIFAWMPDSQHIVDVNSLAYHFIRIAEAAVGDLPTEKDYFGSTFKGERELIKIPLTYFHISYLACSPDGHRLLFLGTLPFPLYYDNSTNSASVQLYVMNLDDLNPTLLVDGVTGHPVWSPDSSKIAFDQNIIKLDGPYLGEPKSHTIDHIINMPARDLAWSPDGSQIAFVSKVDQDDDIFVANVDGSGVKRLTQNSGYSGGLTWLPAE